MRLTKFALLLGLAVSSIVLSGCTDEKMQEANENLSSALIRNGIFNEISSCSNDGSSPCNGKLLETINAISSATGMDKADAENYLAQTINVLSDNKSDTKEIKEFINNKNRIVEMAKYDYDNSQAKGSKEKNIWK